MLDPLLPGFLGNIFVNTLAELAGIGWKVQPFGFIAKLDAVHHTCHCG
jgi:hypothetical protein